VGIVAVLRAPLRVPLICLWIALADSFVIKATSINADFQICHQGSVIPSAFPTWSIMSTGTPYRISVVEFQICEEWRARRDTGTWHGTIGTASKYPVSS